MRKSLTVLTLASLMLSVAACTTIPPTPGSGGSGGGGAGGDAAPAAWAGRLARASLHRAGNPKRDRSRRRPQHLRLRWADESHDRCGHLNRQRCHSRRRWQSHRRWQRRSSRVRSGRRYEVELRGMTITRAAPTWEPESSWAPVPVVTLTGCSITNATPTFSGLAPASTYRRGRCLTLVDSTISGNVAAAGGAIGVAAGGTANVLRSTISDNEAEDAASGGIGRRRGSANGDQQHAFGQLPQRDRRRLRIARRP